MLTARLPPVLPLLYANGRGISKAKYDDIMSLLKYIPPVHPNFYNSLKYEASTGSSDPEALDEFCEACENQQAAAREQSLCDESKTLGSSEEKNITVKLLSAFTTTTETDTSCCSLTSPVTPVRAGAASAHQGPMARTRRQLSLQLSPMGVLEKENIPSSGSAPKSHHRLKRC